MKKNITLIILMILVSGFFFTGCSNEDKSDDIKVNSELKPISSDLPLSVRIAQSFVRRHPGNVTYDEYMTKKKWNYEQGVMLESMRKMYQHTGDEQYYNFVKGNLEYYIEADGSIKTYPYEAFNLDKIKPGGALLFVYEKEKDVKLKKAADTLMKQLANQPRTESGGYWHKKRYPYQMWLDGLFMAQPFKAEYCSMFGINEKFDDILFQFTHIYEKTVDKNSGLLYHAWNENKEQQWADKETGCSPHFWGRAIGWYMMAIVDVLDYVPEDHPEREKLYEILGNVSEAISGVRDPESKLWFQVLDLPEREGNYLEASCAAMFTYALAKGANEGYIDKKFTQIAKESYEAIMKHHVEIDENGYIDLLNTCSAAGLGGDPYRDGSFEYYISEPTRKNDFKGYGPFLYSAIELEKAGVL